MNRHFGKPVMLVNVGSNFAAGPFVLLPARREGEIWIQKCGPEARRKSNLRIRRTGDVDSNGANGPWATFRTEPFVPLPTPPPPPPSSVAAAAAAPPLYAASVEATSFVGVGTGLALGVAHDAAGEIVLAAVQPPGAAGALPGWRIQEADPQTVAAAAAAAAAELAWIVSVEHPDLRFGPFLLKRPNGNDLLHAQPFKLGCNSDGHGNLRVVGTGRMSTNGGQGKWAQFVLRPAAVAATSGRGAGGEAEGEAGGGKKVRGVDSSTIKTVRIMCVGNADKGWCLGVAQPSGGGGAKHRHLIGTATVSAPGTLFDLQAVSTAGVAALPHSWTSSLSSAPQFDDSVDLTEEQRQRFVDDGYLHVKQAVPPELVHDALGAINAALCKPGGNVAVDDGDGSTQYCPGVGGSDAVLNLLKHSAVWTFAQRLLGKGKIMDVQRGQIALRPPNLALLAAGGPQKDDGSLPPKQWHIDGMGKQKHSPFSLLVGITLSDVLQPNCGNFCVFPNSHVKLLPLLRKQVESGSSLFSNENSTDKPAFANGVQLLAEAGDAVFVHQKTAHRGGPNASHLIRYQVYFRLRHKDHVRNIENGSLLDDLFVEFEGLQ